MSVRLQAHCKKYILIDWFRQHIFQNARAHPSIPWGSKGNIHIVQRDNGGTHSIDLDGSTFLRTQEHTLSLHLRAAKYVETTVERIVLVIERAVELHQERQRLAALAAAHVLWGWQVARVKPHLVRNRPK